MKQDPIGPKVHPSTSPSLASHRQTVPVQDEMEAPPPYSPSTSTSVSQPTPVSPVSPVSTRSSQSSRPGEDVPLQRPRSQGGSSDGYGRTDGMAASTSNVSGGSGGGADQGYAPAAPMSSEPKEEEKDWESQPGCCFSDTGGCCFSDHGGCCFSSYEGCLFSDHGGCCFSDNGGCCFGDDGGCCFSDGVVSRSSPSDLL